MSMRHYALCAALLAALGAVLLLAGCPFKKFRADMAAAEAALDRYEEAIDACGGDPPAGETDARLEDRAGKLGCLLEREYESRGLLAEARCEIRMKWEDARWERA